MSWRTQTPKQKHRWRGLKEFEKGLKGDTCPNEKRTCNWTCPRQHNLKSVISGGKGWQLNNKETTHRREHCEREGDALCICPTAREKMTKRTTYWLSARKQWKYEVGTNPGASKYARANHDADDYSRRVKEAQCSCQLGVLHEQKRPSLQ